MTPPVKQMITTGRTQDAAPGTGEKFNTGYIWAVSLAGALGGLLFGYDWVVIGGAKPFYEKFRSARRSAWYRGKVQYRLYLGGFPGRSARGIGVRIRLGGYRWREAVLREVLSFGRGLAARLGNELRSHWLSHRSIGFRRS